MRHCSSPHQGPCQFASLCAIVCRFGSLHPDACVEHHGRGAAAHRKPIRLEAKKPHSLFRSVAQVLMVMSMSNPTCVSSMCTTTTHLRGLRLQHSGWVAQATFCPQQRDVCYGHSMPCTPCAWRITGTGARNSGCRTSAVVCFPPPTSEACAARTAQPCSQNHCPVLEGHLFP
jgi:hypothetical protein